MTISAQIKLSRRVFSGSYSAQFGQRAQLPIDLRTGDDYDHVAGRFKWRCNRAGAARMLVYKGGEDNTTRPLLGWHANGHATMELFHAVLLELCHTPCQRDDR